MSLLIAILASLTLLVAQALPLAASATQGESGGWIEICSGSGSVFIQLDADGSQPATPASDCNHCPFCLVPFNAFLGFDAPPSLTGPALYFTKTRFSALAFVFVKALNAHRPSCRGPPLLNMDNTMNTNTRSVSARLQTVLKSNTWGVPC